MEDSYEKVRTFRNRKSRRRADQQDHDHPVHRPYEREHKNWKHSVVVDGLGDSDFEDTEDDCREGYCACDPESKE
jgi:hypothetical protein